jgi:hypothetical protein
MQRYGLPNLRESQFWDSRLWVLGRSDIWVLAFWPSTKNTIKGKVVASPSLNCGQSCESMFASGSSMHQKRSNYALTNLFCLCRSMWVSNLLVIFPSPYLRVPTRPSTPEVLRAKECTPIPYSSDVFTLDSQSNPLRSLGMCHLLKCNFYVTIVWAIFTHWLKFDVGF